MKRVYILLIIALCSAAPALGQQDFGKVQVHEPRIAKDGENVTVTFRAAIDQKAVKRNYSLVLAPVLTDGTYHWTFPAIIVQGKGAKLLEERHMLASGRSVAYNDALYTTNGQTVDYSAEIPYQLWMEGASLVMDAANVGCCSASELFSETMATEIKLSPPAIVPQIIAPPAIILTTGEKLAGNKSYIRPYSEYEEILPGQIYDEDRENALIVYFMQGNSEVMPDFATNRQSLDDLLSSVHAIQSSGDSKVRKIVIAGFASPEGTFSFNDRLSWNRAIAVKEYTVEHSGLEPDVLEIYNGSEDWRGLRALVEASDMEGKREVLDIIENVPIIGSATRAGRLRQLQQLDGGRPYEYLYENFFPRLRNAAYIKVYYGNTDEETR